MAFQWLLFNVVLLGCLIVLVFGQFNFKGNAYIEQQLMCALDRAPCDAFGRQIKSALPEIIGKNCRSCDSRQVANARRVAQFVQGKYPDVWNALVEKYKPK